MQKDKTLNKVQAPTVGICQAGTRRDGPNNKKVIKEGTENQMEMDHFLKKNMF